MKQWIKVLQQSKSQDKSQLLFEGFAQKQPLNNGFLLTYDETSNIHVNISVFDEELFIKRIGEITSYLYLHHLQTTPLKLQTAQGVLHLQTHTLAYRHSPTNVFVEYAIMQAQTLIEQFAITIEIKEDAL